LNFNVTVVRDLKNFGLAGFAPTGSVAFRSAPPKHLANVVCMKGAQVKFAYKTTPCVSSRRYLLNLWPVSQKSSDAAAVLKVLFIFIEKLRLF